MTGSSSVVIAKIFQTFVGYLKYQGITNIIWYLNKLSNQNGFIL